MSLSPEIAQQKARELMGHISCGSECERKWLNGQDDLCDNCKFVQKKIASALILADKEATELAAKIASLNGAYDIAAQIREGG